MFDSPCAGALEELVEILPFRYGKLPMRPNARGVEEDASLARRNGWRLEEVKPFEVRFTAMPAEDTGSSVAVQVTGGRQLRQTHTITSLADLERISLAVARAYGQDCAVWCGPERARDRKPVGFDKEANRLSKVLFRIVKEQVAS